MQERLSRVRFGNFELDVCSGELRKSGLRIRIEDQPLRLLVALVEQPGAVLTREELRKAIWPEDTYVDFERSLSRAMNKVRTAIGDSAANPRFIETLPRRGYRFIAPVSIMATDCQVLSSTRTDGYELQPGTASTSEFPTSEISTQSARARPQWLVAAALISILLVTALAALILPRLAQKRIVALAVLPFENFSASAQSEFGDAMTDQLIGALSRIRSLRVVSHKSVMRYRSDRRNLSDIAAELNVEAIVQGSVTLSDERMRIGARLIRFPGARTFWTKTYERYTRDILSIQTELVRNVASEIGALISPEEEKRMAIETRTVNPELHALYMQGRLFVKEPGRDSIERGIHALEKVLERNPGQADAWAALADGWFSLSSVYLPPVEAMPRAKAAARKALELDPESDTALAVLGRIHVFYDWDWQAAGERLQKAVDLNPNSSEAWRGMGFLKMAIGRPDESFQAIDRALQLDPMSLWAHFQSALTLACARRHDESIHRARRALDWEPEFGFMRSVLGIVHAEKGEFRQAIQELERAVESQRVPTTLAFLAHGYAVSGRTTEAEKILAELVLMANQHYVCPFEVAQAFASLGRKDDAFRWMSKAIDDRADCMIWLRAEPWLDPIRSDSRYSALVRKVGFP